MKQLIRLTESDLHNMIREAVSRVLKEDGIGGGGATNAAGAMQGGGTNPSAGQYDVPFGGGVQRRKIYSPKDDKVGDGMTEVDMKPALKRKDGKNGSISIPKN